MAENTLGSIDILELMKLLPHRYPFLLLDRIVDVDGDNSATGIKNVTFNEPHFQGHFPTHPVKPGVLLDEAMAQVAGAISLRAAGSDKPTLVYFLTIDDAKFRKPVIPGDRLEIKVRKIKKRGNIVRFACEAFVDGTMTAEAEIQAMLAPAGEA